MGETVVKEQICTVLRGVRWETYQALALDLAETPSKKLTYDRGILEIMTPLPAHEANKRFLGRIVELTTDVLGLEIYSLGSTTWSKENLQKGIEPDECYYITNEKLVRGKQVFNLDIDPVPDLVIEIDITNSSLDRLGIYAALGVKEVWRFDGRQLLIYVLGEGCYEVRENSEVLPVLVAQDILVFIEKRKETGENSLLREFRQWLENKLSG